MKKIDAIPDLNVATGTHAGMVGKNNEDDFSFSAWELDGQKLALGIVADGVGGQSAGEQASRLTIETVTSYFEKLEELTADTILDHMEAAISQANLAVFDQAQNETEFYGMATTIVMAAIWEGRLYTSHAGDSRIYILRDGELYQLTHDHTWVQEAIDSGFLTRDQARVHPNRNVIRRSLGSMTEVDIDQIMSTGAQGMPLTGGDTLLLCSDGLTDMINDAAITDTLQTHGENLEEAVEQLIDKANKAGGKDNITVVVMQLKKDVEPVGLVATLEKTEAAPLSPTPAPPIGVETEAVEEVVNEPPAAVESGAEEEAEAEPALAAAVETADPENEPDAFGITPGRVVSVPLDREEKRRAARRRRWIILLTLLVLVVIAVALGYAFLQGWLTPQPDIEVPIPTPAG